MSYSSTTNTTTDYGGGDVGGNDYNDALFSCGPRGKNKPDINEKAVVVLPDLSNGKGYRGHHDLRRPDGTMATYDSGKFPILFRIFV